MHRIFEFLLLALLLIEFGIFFYQEREDIQVISQVIVDNELSRVLKNVKVVQISDLHIHRIGRRERKLISTMRDINPDLIFITGDFIDNKRGIKPLQELVDKMANPETLIIGILGNSDHECGEGGVNLLLKRLRESGVKMLVNETLKLNVTMHHYPHLKNHKNPDNYIYVVGLDDNYTWNDNFFKAMNNVPLESPIVLLAHAPHIVEKVNTSGIDLVLSGHTHGGQIVVPFLGPIYLNSHCTARKRFTSGLYLDEGTKLYVNRGIGTTVLPIRLFCKPEITLFQFASNSKDQ
jgi:predicted MPP superfamily phosphohydrolase